MLHHLFSEIQEKINNITFFSEETLVIDHLGTIELLEGHPRVKYLYTHQYFIIKKNELLNPDLTDNLMKFIKNMLNNLDQITDDIALYFQRILFTDENVLNRFNENKMKYITDRLSELLNMPSDSTEIRQIAFSCVENGLADDYFNFMLRILLSEKIKDGLTNLKQKKKYISSKLHEKLGDHHVDAEKKLFFTNEIARILSISETRIVLTKALEIPNLRIYVSSSNQENFKRLVATYVPKNHDRYGLAHAEHDVIYVFCNQYRNRFPLLSILGGLSYDENIFPVGTNTSEQLENARNAAELHTPLAATIVEEMFDYMREKTFKNMAHSDALFEQFGKTLIAAKKTIKAQQIIANLILRGKKLTRKQEKTWHTMKDTAAFIRTHTHVEARQFIAPIAKKNVIGDQITIALASHGITLDFSVKKILYEYQQNPKKQIALLEAPPVGLELSDAETSSLFLTIGKSILSDIEITLGSYVKELFNVEMAGKLPRYYVFFPGYFENMHRSLHAQQMKILSTIATFNLPTSASDKIICTNDECIINSNTAPLILPAGQIAYLPIPTNEDRMLTSDSTSSYITVSSEFGNSSALVTQALSTQEQTALPYDFGYWDPEIHIDSNTGLPKFIYYVVKDEQIIGSASFLSQPTLCQLNEGHNIIEACGILENIVSEINPCQINEICLMQPQTFLQNVFNNSLNNIEIGASRGLSNVVYDTLIQSNFSTQLAYFISEMSFYTMYFYITLHRHKNLMDDSSAMYQASIDTITGFLLGQSLHLVTKMGHWAFENGYTWGGRILVSVGNFGLLAYQSISDGLMMTVNTTVGILSQVATEHVGKATVNFLKQRIQVLAPMVAWALEKKSEAAPEKEVRPYFSI